MDQLSYRPLATHLFVIAQARAKDLAYWIGRRDRMEAAPDEVHMYIAIEDDLWIYYRYIPVDDELTVMRMFKPE